jgi:hypothetical protein
MAWRWLGLLLVLAVATTALALIVRAGADDREQVSFLNFSFVAREVRTIQSQFMADQRLVTDIEYQGLNAWRMTCHDQPYCSTVVIGERAWNLQGDIWREVSLPSTFGTEALAILDIAAGSFQRVGLGDTIAGEATAGLVAFDPTYGDRWAARYDETGQRMLVDEYAGATLTVRVVRGEDSGRIYETTVTIEGPNVRDESTITFEYDGQLNIQPPPLSLQ